jgi:4-amino-4-deoxy-L-arabinose transferase-like glycosyltransferase
MIGRRDHLIGLALCVGYVLLLLHTAPDLGMSRDEGMYVQAAEAYGGWVELLWRDPKQALTQEAIDQAFRVNREHPPLFKLLSGLGFLAQRAWHPFKYDSSAYRFAGMLSAGLLLWLIYVFGARLYGRAAGAFAAVAFALLPRPFYHAHLNAFDVPITLANTAVIYAYVRSLEDERWGYACGALFGLALLTKHNSWILPGILSIHYLLVAWRARKLRWMTPHALIACVTLGPLVFFAGWPFLWHDSLERLGWYLRFHLHHEYYNMEYFGVNYFWPPFPSSYAWVMTLYTVPLTTLLLGVVGTAERLLALLPARATPRAWAEEDPKLITLLLAGALFAPLLLMSLPSTPIFGGTKHWFPAYPFLCLFAGSAFIRLLELARERFGERLPPGGWRLVPPLAASWLLAPALVETVHSHPFALSHYTVAAGGVPGAAESGMNRQFWGFTSRSLAPYLREVMPNGGTVYICDTISIAWQMLARDGFLPENIRPSYDIARSDYVLVHHEKHFAEIDHQIWTTYGSVQPVYVLRYDGVPIISVYKNPRR